MEEDGAGGWRYRRDAPDLHVLFGWLQVGEVLDLGPGSAALRASRPELAEHPHMNGRWDAGNTLYVATDRLVIDGQDLGVAGGGTFGQFHPGLQLTVPGENRSLWSLPGWFLPESGPTLSYHTDPARWQRDGDRCAVKVVGRGQEFVMEQKEGAETTTWLRTLIRL